MGVVINPVSGRDGRRPETGLRRAALARTLCDARGIDAEIVLTAGPGHATAIAERFMRDGCARIVAWGGDGTVAEATRPLIGSTVIAGIVRSGSGDGFARGLGIPARAAAALDVAMSSHTRAIDVGCFGDRYFLNVAGIGFDAAVARAFNDRSHRGLPGYLLEVWRALWSYRAEFCDLELDGIRHSGRPFLVAFANGPEYGNGIVVAPDADLSDGWLDVVVVAEGPVVRQVWRARRLLIGRRRVTAGITRVRVRRARVTAPRLVCHLDGETFALTEKVDISILPGALQVAVPTSATDGPTDRANGA